MAYNKIIYGEDTLIDLTEDTVTPDKLLIGYTAHDKTGSLIVGTAAGEVGQVRTLEELESNWDNEGGFLLSYDPATGDRTYILNAVTTSKGVFNETTSYDGATRWFLEQVEGYTDRFYVYTYINSVKEYMYNNTATNANFMGLSDTSKAIFIISCEAEGKFLFKISTSNRWLQHSNSGGGMRLYTDHNNANNTQLTFTYQQNSIVPYGTLTITENGTYDVTNYKNVVINIS